MSLEQLNSIATLGTFVVIAATAIVALFQLRHSRGHTQLGALTEVQRAFHAPEYIAALSFVLGPLARQWEEPEFRYQLTHRGARSPQNQPQIQQAMLVGNTYELLGLFVWRKLIDRELALDLYAANGLKAWNKLADVCAALRRDDHGAWENFEYFVVLGEDWKAAHPHGAFPPGARRFPLTDHWREADAAFEAARPRE